MTMSATIVVVLNTFMHHCSQAYGESHINMVGFRFLSETFMPQTVSLYSIGHPRMVDRIMRMHFRVFYLLAFVSAINTRLE